MSQLNKGRSEFHNSEVYVINDKISCWGFGIPENKHLRGFGNDVCGRLMCPSTQDWENSTYGMIWLYSPGRCRTDAISHRTRGRIQSYQISITADEFPRFLWEGERVDPQDMNKGFLRGELLTKVRISFQLEPEMLTDASPNACRYSSPS